MKQNKIFFTLSNSHSGLHLKLKLVAKPASQISGPSNVTDEGQTGISGGTSDYPDSTHFD